MNIGIAQISSKDNIDKNVEHILEYVKKGSEHEMDMLCFPECSLVGYCNILINGESSLADGSQLENAIDRVHKLGTEKGMDIIVGSPLFEKNNVFNAGIVLPAHGERMHYRKNNLTAEEAKFFKPGEQTLIFQSHGVNFGIMICRDQNYPLLSMKYKYKSVKALFMLAAHYYTPDEAVKKRDKNRALPIARAIENGFYVLKANAVGEKNGYVSLGGSVIVSPDGEVLSEANDADECILNHELATEDDGEFLS